MTEPMMYVELLDHENRRCRLHVPERWSRSQLVQHLSHGDHTANEAARAFCARLPYGCLDGADHTHQLVSGAPPYVVWDRRPGDALVDVVTPVLGGTAKPYVLWVLPVHTLLVLLECVPECGRHDGPLPSDDADERRRKSAATFLVTHDTLRRDCATRERFFQHLKRTSGCAPTATHTHLSSEHARTLAKHVDTPVTAPSSSSSSSSGASVRSMPPTLADPELPVVVVHHLPPPSPHWILVLAFLLLLALKWAAGDKRPSEVWAHFMNE